VAGFERVVAVVRGAKRRLWALALHLLRFHLFVVVKAGKGLHHLRKCASYKKLIDIKQKAKVIDKYKSKYRGNIQLREKYAYFSLKVTRNHEIR
jgi:hypothetical protein